MKRRKPMSKECREIMAKLPRCRNCHQLVLSKVDKIKGSQMVEWMGQNWTKHNPTFIPMYPSGEFPELCHNCTLVKYPPQVGKDS